VDDVEQRQGDVGKFRVVVVVVVASSSEELCRRRLFQSVSVYTTATTW
jgi:hypothetical protein